MPQLLAPDSGGESSRSRSRQRARTEANEHRSMWDRLSLQKIGSWLKREEEEPPPAALDEKQGRLADDDSNKENGRPHSSGDHTHLRPGGFLGRRSSRKVIPGLPRPPTFKRMNSEKREKLLPVPIDSQQRRAVSVDRRESNALSLKRTLSPPHLSVPSSSAPDVLSPHTSEHEQKQTIGGGEDSNIPAGARQVDYGVEETVDYMSAGEPPPLSIAGDSFYERGSHRSSSDIDELLLQEELERKWILNLSMHFRDMSDREKFFLTYAEEPNKWRRVTVSCDYRDIVPQTLEADLKSLHYQRDKSARIYEAIRDSLPDVQFYDTVTNLKLQTANGRLHVHVTEDINEIIPYPPISALDHLDCKIFNERAISFDSHISGFVYKVSVQNQVYIKKEIPGPDAVEEFLYEINALSSLQDSKSVIKFEGIIVDDKGELIKGLLISYAEQGALVDLIYDYKNSERLPWERRERWARQIVEGLAEIHEAGFVQGDFTLSNIVIDHNDDAKIIDINRRGCPVGWEPPELARLIESGQRISIYIGVKSDIFQLGMVLWALAEQQDEPERQERPLSFSKTSTVPAYFHGIIRSCLSDLPRERQAAKEMLKEFPECANEPSNAMTESRQSVSSHRSDKEYIDPVTAVGLDDITTHRQRSRSSFSNINMPSSEYIGSSGSYILPNTARGHSPGGRSPSQNRRPSCSPHRAPRSVMSLDDSEPEPEVPSLPPSRGARWEAVYIDGDTQLVQRASLGIDAHDFATQEPKEVCITTPPGELDIFGGSKKSDGETPLSLSTVTELPHPQPQLPLEPFPTTTGTFSNAPSVTSNDQAQSGHSRNPSSEAFYYDRFPGLVPQVLTPVAELHPSQPLPTTDHSAVPSVTSSELVLSDPISNQSSEPFYYDHLLNIAPQDTVDEVPSDPETKLGHHRHPSSKASFSDRVHNIVQHDDFNTRMSKTLADLENEIAMDSSMTSSMAPSRVGTGFSQETSSLPPSRIGTGLSMDNFGGGFSFGAPLHQDSGFNEPQEERASYESERIRQSLEDRMVEREARLEGRLWDEKDGTMIGIGEGVRGSELVIQPEALAKVSSDSSPKEVVDLKEEDRKLEEKTSNTTIRPTSMGILIPEFHHAVPQPF